jgi:hypothetical protein
MMNSYIAGFEKKAYDYQYEANNLQKKVENMSKEEPSSIARAALLTGLALGGMGAGLGAALGRPGDRKFSAAVGGLLGGVGGLGVGAGNASDYNRDIQDAKNLMSKTKKERDTILRAKARQDDKLTSKETRRALSRFGGRFTPVNRYE